MSESPGVNITLAGDWSKPATALVEAVSNAVGGISRPWQIRRVAKAEADAEREHARARVDTLDLEQRAIQRMINEEAIKQTNIESITYRAAHHLTPNAEPQLMEPDWIFHFFDRAKLISDSKMQEIWARLLAEEANINNTFSKRTINIVSSMNRKDADLFSSLCSFIWVVDGDLTIIIPDEIASAPNSLCSVLQNFGITYESLAHLDSIGLTSLIGPDLQMRMDQNPFSMSYRDSSGCSISRKI